jgi:hypothetical protein
MRACAALLLFLAASPASANEIPCTPVEKGTIRIDGLLGDWKDVDGVGVDQATQILKGKSDWSGPDDLSFDVFCNYDEQNLYLAINVRDEYFIRTRRAAPGDDHLVVHFGAKKLVVYPSNLRGVPAQVIWPGGAKKIQMAEALQEKGYSVELCIPLKLIPGYRPGVSAFPGAVWVADSDSKARGRVETLMGTAPSGKKGAFTFAQAKADLDGFLKDRGYPASAVRTKLSADVAGDRGAEQVVLVGRTIGIIGEGLPGGSFFYLDLPVQQPRDVYWLKVMDLNGDGKMELVTRYVERTGNGRRELLAVFRFNDSNKFIRSFAHEVLKGQGERVVTNRFAFKPRKGKAKGKGGKKRAGGGVDLLVDQPVARGFTEQTYHEDPATDCFPILLPWGEEKKEHFRFEGEEFQKL